ncbi:hypothetical protein [Natronoflexus pectinivorans]|uniref:Uncharacterized protein n=1 Tax=Natronoflexus pectinivorans TaxID=682526 RepID=A0A4V2RWZ3_9BACT|nr:hypothetical protein [Natronoflexus pectinivorans]TCO10901.1 hypothetical protein EV194_101535 [Natronoflexus pectinivorans]
MNCVEFEIRLAKLKSGENPGDEFIKHRNQCAKCTKLANEVEGLFQLIEVDASKTVSPFLSTRIMAALDKKAMEVHISIQKAWQIAAVSLALIAGFNLALFMDYRQSPTDADSVLSEYFFAGNAGMEIENNWLKLSTDED